MATQSQVNECALKTCALFLVHLLCTCDIHAQQNFPFQFERNADGELTQVLKPSPHSAVEAKRVGDDFRILVCDWELGTEESDQHLNSLLNRFAKRNLDKLIKQSQFTPAQIAKLELAARLQVARDCRAIQQLNLAYRYQKDDKPNLFGTCQDIERLLDIGIDRKGSLFRKVLNNLQ